MRSTLISYYAVVYCEGMHYIRLRDKIHFCE